MNDQLVEFAKKTLKEGLEQLTDQNRWVFKLMYGRNNGKRSVKELETMSIEEVINEIPNDKLSWAMEQVNKSLLRSHKDL